MQCSKTVLVCLLMMSGTVAEAGLYDLFDQFKEEMIEGYRNMSTSRACACIAVGACLGHGIGLCLSHWMYKDKPNTLYYHMLHWLRKDKSSSQTVAAGSGAAIKDPALPVGGQPKCLQVSEGPIRARGIVSALAGHPKTLACAAGVLTGAISYVGFTKLRDSRIDAQLDTKIREHVEDCKDLVNATRRYNDTVSVWGKSRDFATKITADKSGRQTVVTWPVSK